MHQIIKEVLVILISILACSFVIAGNAAAVSFTVSNSTVQDADFSSIQAAIDAANPGDEIIIKPGVYEENIEIAKALTIFSESGDPSDTVIQAVDSSKDIFSIWTNGVIIKGFSIKGADSGAGIHFFGVSDCRIEHNVLSNNSCGLDLYMFSSSNMLIDNDISDNLIGISLGDSPNNTLRNNSVSYCNSGISLFDSPNNILENNLVTENNEGISLIGESNGNTLVSNTLKFNKKTGLHIYETSSNLIYNNYFNNTLNVESELVAGENLWNITKSKGINIVDGSYLGGNFWGKPDGTVYPRGARDTDFDGIFDSVYDVEGSGFIDYLPLKELKPTVITVSNSTDQTADFTSIQNALENAYPGDVILVYPGIYVENIMVNVDNISIISASGSPYDTVIQAASSSKDIFTVIADGVEINGFYLSGDVSFPNAGIHLYEVKGCLIENNEFNYLDNLQSFSDDYAPAFANTSNLNPGFGIRLDVSGNNVLNNNTVSYGNACILLRDSGENMLHNNKVSNSTYGIWVDSSTDNVLDNNTAVNNKIGIYLKASSSNAVVGSISLNNSGSCINLWNSNDNTLIDNKASNSSNVCIILYNSSGNDLSSNTVSYSSYGIWLDSSSNKNRLTENRALHNKVGIYLKASNENMLYNNTALKNSKYGISLWNSSANELGDNTASYSDVSILLHNASENILSGNNTASNSSYGIWLDSFSGNNILSGSKASNNKIGIYLKTSDNNALTGSSADLNTVYGMCLSSSSNNTLNNNKIFLNSGYGICILSSNNNLIYNNYLNNMKNSYFDGKSTGNVWNISKEPSTNIAGAAFLGGNFWASPNGSGFSQTHPDIDNDGICEIAYNMGKGNIDHLPIAGSF